MAGESDARDREWLVEQRYRAVLEVLDGSPVSEATPEALTPAAAPKAKPVSGIVLPSSEGAVEFDTVIAPSGQLNILTGVQRVKLGPKRAGQRAHVWADEFSVHIVIDGQLVKTVPSNLEAEDLRHLAMRGALPAGPPPAAPSVARADTLPAGAVVETDRTVDANGVADLANHRLKVGTELARKRVTLRLDGHVVHAVHDGVLAKTLASPIPADQRPKIPGARLSTTELPPPAPGPISVQRKVPREGVIMVARERLRVGRTYAGKIVTISVEDTHFRVTCDGAELSIHPRRTQHPVRR